MIRTDLNDLIGVLAVVFYLAGIGAVTVRTVMLRRRQGARGFWSGALALIALTYMVFIALDVHSVIAVLSNEVDDIPPASTARAVVFGAWLWLLNALLDRLSRGRLI